MAAPRARVVTNQPRYSERLPESLLRTSLFRACRLRVRYPTSPGEQMADSQMTNIDEKTVLGFGEEWQRFDHSAAEESELENIFEQYFSIFPWDSLPQDAAGFDLGCGTGRWAKFVAAKVATLHCIDPSTAIDVARRYLSEASNVELHQASVDDIPLADESMDFGYSLGVLHHVPDTEAGIRSCVAKLKPDAPFLIYLYYALDNRPAWFQKVWKVSNAARNVISELPTGAKMVLTDAIAGAVYWPLARGARLLSRGGVDTSNIPLSAYQDRSFYVMRTDSLDRFGTRLERRFTRTEVQSMMENAGLRDVVVSSEAPYWCAVGYRDSRKIARSDEI